MLAGLAKAFAEREELAPAAKLLSEEPKVAGAAEGALSRARPISPRLPSAILISLPTASCAIRTSTLSAAQGLLAREVEAAKSQKETMAALRRFKRRMALLVGLADLGGVWSTEEMLRAMSVAAEAAVNEAVGVSVSSGARGWADRRARPESREREGYFVVAMGKLGAYELNYSMRHRPHRLLRRRRAPGWRRALSPRLSSSG